MSSYAVFHPLKGAVPPPRISEEEDSDSGELSDGLPPMIDIWDVRNPFAAHNCRRIPSRIRRARRYEHVGPLDRLPILFDSIDECSSEEDYGHLFDDSDSDFDESDSEEEESGESSGGDSDDGSDVEEKAGIGGDFDIALPTGTTYESDDEDSEDSVEGESGADSRSDPDSDSGQLVLPRLHPVWADLCRVYNKLADDEERRSRRT